MHRTRNLSILAAGLAAAFASCAPALGQGLSERIRAVGEQKQESLRNNNSRGRLLGALLYVVLRVFAPERADALRTRVNGL